MNDTEEIHILGQQLTATEKKDRYRLDAIIDRLREISQGKMTGSEAIFGFVGWLTTRKEKVVMSSQDDCAAITGLIEEFCKVNNLPEPRENWSNNLIHPDGECSG